MIPSLILLATMFVVGVVLWWLDRRKRAPEVAEDDSATAAPAQDGCNDSCCAVNPVCPSEMLLQAAQSCDNYYDDEELDSYRGREAHQYSTDELEQWRDVLYTLQPEERLGWERAIKRRGIVMPEVIRDELVMLVGEMQ